MRNANHLLFVMALLIGSPGLLRADSIEVKSVLLRLIEQVDVPAREAGVLDELAIREGQTVERGALLARIEGAQAQLVEGRARLELEIATKKSKNDVKVRFAKKSLEVTRAELKRADESIKKYPKSISQTELDRLRLTVERTILEVEQSRHEMEVEKLTRSLKENELALAAVGVERRRIVAPFKGVVVEIHARRGEWVEPGEPVMRLLRIDRLRAEGFVDTRDLGEKLAGRSVTLSVDLPSRPGARFSGKIVFVSPEIDPVNNQVRVWAEIENRDLVLRPGLRAKMSIADR